MYGKLDEWWHSRGVCGGVVEMKHPPFSCIVGNGGCVGLEGDDFMEQPELWVVEPKERGGELYKRSYSGEKSDGS